VKAALAANVIQSFQFKFSTRHKFMLQRDCCGRPKWSAKSLKCHNAQFCALKALCSIIYKNCLVWPLTLVRHNSKSPLQVWYARAWLTPRVATLVTRHAKTHSAAEFTLQYLTLFCSAHAMVATRELKKFPTWKCSHLGASNRRIMKQVIWVLTTKVILKD
jgi:hypothetical protein